MKLLEADPAATITFLNTDLKSFLLAVLKSFDRRNWVRQRIGRDPIIIESAQALGITDITNLSDAQNAAILWGLNEMMSRSLFASKEADRVLPCDGAFLAERPEDTLRLILRHAGLDACDQEIRELVNHPTARKYSKDLSISYDADSRRREPIALESRYSLELEDGLDWASQYLSLMVNHRSTFLFDR